MDQRRSPLAAACPGLVPPDTTGPARVARIRTPRGQDPDPAWPGSGPRLTPSGAGPCRTAPDRAGPRRTAPDRACRRGQDPLAGGHISVIGVFRRPVRGILVRGPL